MVPGRCIERRCSVVVHVWRSRRVRRWPPLRGRALRDSCGERLVRRVVVQVWVRRPRVANGDVDEGSLTTDPERPAVGARLLCRTLVGNRDVACEHRTCQSGEDAFVLDRGQPAITGAGTSKGQAMTSGNTHMRLLVGTDCDAEFSSEAGSADGERPVAAVVACRLLHVVGSVGS
jgi:hypothetical protein